MIRTSGTAQMTPPPLLETKDMHKHTSRLAASKRHALVLCYANLQS